ncbi:hypothetical protein ERO13_A11G131425v2 [Gossypium hirsutum]|nr:hypothetical protein ERO13_A11G131425v2 [Gossypium hirsutum]
MDGMIKGTAAVHFFHFSFTLVVVYHAGPFVVCYFLAGPSLFVLFVITLMSFGGFFSWNQFLDSY